MEHIQKIAMWNRNLYAIAIGIALAGVCLHCVERILNGILFMLFGCVRSARFRQIGKSPSELPHWESRPSQELLLLPIWLYHFSEPIIVWEAIHSDIPKNDLMVYLVNRYITNSIVIFSSEMHIYVGYDTQIAIAYLVIDICNRSN